MSLCHSNTLMAVTGPLLVWAQPIFLAMQHLSLAMPCQCLVLPL